MLAEEGEIGAHAGAIGVQGARARAALVPEIGQPSGERFGAGQAATFRVRSSTLAMKLTNSSPMSAVKVSASSAAKASRPWRAGSHKARRTSATLPTAGASRRTGRGRWRGAQTRELAGAEDQVDLAGDELPPPGRRRRTLQSQDAGRETESQPREIVDAPRQIGVIARFQKVDHRGVGLGLCGEGGRAMASSAGARPPRAHARR